MREIQVHDHTVFIGNAIFSKLNTMLSRKEYRDAKKFVLVDEHTLEHCWPIIGRKVKALEDAEILEITSGEEQKNLDICYQIWNVLSEYEADRKALIINLGGGVIGDMGGFIAATYKRGIRFINLPTTLLAQVDASVGGKTGVDLNNLKNHVGVFANPEAVFIGPVFLETLPDAELRSGSAEMFKHALVADAAYWVAMCEVDLRDEKRMTGLVARSVEIKRDIVEADPQELGWRKLLNFGHTIGHALETWSLEADTTSLLHGDAVAAGMICEAWISIRKAGLSQEDFNHIAEILIDRFPAVHFEDMAVHRLLELMRHDKKNEGNRINFTLLESLGKGQVDHTCSNEEIVEALYAYRELTAAKV